jgi:hypothetical protein
MLPFLVKTTRKGFFSPQRPMQRECEEGSICTMGLSVQQLTRFSVGKRLGRKLFAREDAWFFITQHLDRARHFYARHGGKPSFLRASSILSEPWHP